MPLTGEARRAYNKAYYEALKGDPDHRKREADRLFNAYWTNPEKKRQQNREYYYRSRGKKLPEQIRPYRHRDPATRPPSKFKFTPPPPPPENEIVTNSIAPPTSFNMRDLFS